jgi:glycosyltransferase involved in cell wall biosynthesis
MGYDLNYLEISEDMTSALNKCDGFIVDCFLHYQLLEQKIFANHKLFQSAYGCDVSLFSQIIPERGSGLNIMINRGPSKQHGNELVIKALQELNFLGIDYHATFVGDHFTNQYFELLLNKLRQNNRVTVLNSVDQTHMLEIMKQNWVYLSGSISDGSSISLLEAMSGGLIPVISDWSSNLEWISDNYNGIIFQNENFESLVQSLIKLSNLNESVRELMVARNRKIVHSRGNWEINGPQILAHIEKCLRS